MEIFYHKVRIYKKPAERYHKDCFEIKKVVIIAENDNYIVIDDAYFTRISKKKSYCDTCLNVEKINIRTENHILGDGVFFTLYSEKKLRPSTIKRHIEKKIIAQYGWLNNDIDLSIIT